MDIKHLSLFRKYHSSLHEVCTSSCQPLFKEQVDFIYRDYPSEEIKPIEVSCQQQELREKTIELNFTKCMVCLESFQRKEKQVAILECEHKLHLNCLKHMQAHSMQADSQCGICREPLEVKCVLNWNAIMECPDTLVDLLVEKDLKIQNENNYHDTQDNKNNENSNTNKLIYELEKQGFNDNYKLDSKQMKEQAKKRNDLRKKQIQEEAKKRKEEAKIRNDLRKKQIQEEAKKRKEEAKKSKEEEKRAKEESSKIKIKPIQRVQMKVDRPEIAIPKNNIQIALNQFQNSEQHKHNKSIQMQVNNDSNIDINVFKPIKGASYLTRQSNSFTNSIQNYEESDIESIKDDLQECDQYSESEYSIKTDCQLVNEFDDDFIENENVDYSDDEMF